MCISNIVVTRQFVMNEQLLVNGNKIWVDIDILFFERFKLDLLRLKLMLPLHSPEIDAQAIWSTDSYSPILIKETSNSFNIINWNPGKEDKTGTDITFWLGNAACSLHPTTRTINSGYTATQRDTVGQPICCLDSYLPLWGTLWSCSHLFRRTPSKSTSW